jgi:hypothetical protein
MRQRRRPPEGDDPTVATGLLALSVCLLSIARVLPFATRRATVGVSRTGAHTGEGSLMSTEGSGLPEAMGFEDLEAMVQALGFPDPESLAAALGYRDLRDLASAMGFRDLADLSRALGFEGFESSKTIQDPSEPARADDNKGGT